MRYPLSIYNCNPKLEEAGVRNSLWGKNLVSREIYKPELFGFAITFRKMDSNNTIGVEKYSFLFQ